MPERIGRYEILQELGRGAMGAVYKARDPQIGRTVAIKMILTANLTPPELELYKQRFRREAQAAGQMSHPGIVTIHDIAEEETGQPFLVMEFVEGTTLDKLVGGSPGETPPERLPFSQTLEIGIQVARALDYAHRRGVIHRDIKPANILITSDGQAKIADFGIAKLSGTQLTQTGQLMGTPAFMSPEQFSGAAVDSRADLFSLGAMLYWMCTGEKPFSGDTLTAVSFKIVYAQPISAQQLNPALPAEIDTVFARCLAKNPADRYATGRALADDLEAVKAGRPIAATPLAPPVAEKTMLQAAPLPAAAAAQTPTQLLGQPPEKTIALASPPPVERTVPLPTPGQAPGWLAGIRARAKLIAGVAAGLLLVVSAGWWLWPAEKAERTRQQEATETSRPQDESRDSGPPPWSKARPRPRDPTPRAVANSTLRIDCRHNFRSATLEIFSDDRLLIERPLRGEELEFGLKIVQGSLQTSTPIPAGRHILRVRVKSPREDYDQDVETVGTFPEGGARTLVIEFGKGSAFGVIERKLTLRWR